MKHPAILQIRGETDKEEIKKVVERNCSEYDYEDLNMGFNVYITDVNDARTVISKLKRIANSKPEIKMSTKYAGLRDGKVRVLFVYSLRFNDKKNSRVKSC